jgi:hypothetical protein
MLALLGLPAAGCADKDGSTGQASQARIDGGNKQPAGQEDAPQPKGRPDPLAKAVTLEMQVSRFKHEIDKLDAGINGIVGKVASLDVECNGLKEEVSKLAAGKKELKDEMAAMAKALESKGEKVSYKGDIYTSAELARKLDGALRTFTSCKEALAAKEALLDVKSRTLEAARNRAVAMQRQKQELVEAVAKLEIAIADQLLKGKDGKLKLDEREVRKTKELLDKVQADLGKLDVDAKLKGDFGSPAGAPPERESKNPEEVLKAARKALEDDARKSTKQGDKGEKK